MSWNEPVLLGPSTSDHAMEAYLHEQTKDLGELISARFKAHLLASYSFDSQTLLQRHPYAVFRPRTIEAIGPFIKLCKQLQLTVTPRCGGTGMTGGCLPGKRGVILLTNHFKQLLDYNSIQGTICAEAGATSDQINEKIFNDGWRFPYIMATRGAAGIAGIVSACAKPWYIGRLPPLEGLISHVSYIDQDGNENTSAVSQFCGAEGSKGVIVKLCLRLEKKPFCSIWLAYHVELTEIISACADLERLAAVKSIFWQKTQGMPQVHIALEGPNWQVLIAQKYLDALFDGRKKPSLEKPELFASRRRHLFFVSAVPFKNIEKAYLSLMELFGSIPDCAATVSIQLLDGRLITLIEGIDISEEAFVLRVRSLLESWINILEALSGHLCACHSVGILFKDFMPPFFSESTLAFLVKERSVNLAPDNFIPQYGKSVEKVCR